MNSKKVSRIILINLASLLVVYIANFTRLNVGDTGFTFFLMAMVAYVLEFIVGIVLAVGKNTETGLAILLSGLLCFLIGFSVCMANISI